MNGTNTYNYRCKIKKEVKQNYTAVEVKTKASYEGTYE
jgi:hypothetical protein